MATSKDVLDALDQIQQTNFDSVVISFLVAAVALMLLKIIAEAITGFIQLRLDQHIAIGTTVEVYGKKGRVKEVTLFTVTIETECGYVRVPTKSWRASKFLILKDSQPLHNRRKDDK
jgi:small-conductance mechanosensitive channel